MKTGDDREGKNRIGNARNGRRKVEAREKDEDRRRRRGGEKNRRYQSKKKTENDNEKEGNESQPIRKKEIGDTSERKTQNPLVLLV